MTTINTIGFLQVDHTLDQYIDLLFSLNNPLLYLILFIFLFITILLLTSRNVIRPMKQKHEQEKVKLELEKVRLTALFAELNPDPLIRINEKGIITSCNKSAQQLLGVEILEGKFVFDILQQIEFDTEELIERQNKISHFEVLNNRHYSVHIEGIKDLKFAQIYFHDITEQKETETKLKDYQQKLRELSRDINSKTEEERRRIAAELHDSVGQQLSLLKIKAQQISFKKSDGENNNQIDLLKTVDDITGEVRAILYQLKPKVLDELGLGAAIASLVETVKNETGINGSVDLSGDAIRFYPEFEINIFRVVQEAVNNIIKHSKADEFSVQLIYMQNNLRIIVTDNGNGFDQSGESSGKLMHGYGLINMHERAESLGGKIKIDSNPNEGTMILLDVPTIKEVKND